MEITEATSTHDTSLITEGEKHEEKKLRAANVESIEGLKEILDATYALQSWHRRFNASFSNEGGCVFSEAMPKADPKELSARYPQAAAYIRVKQRAESQSYNLASIGSKALYKFETNPSAWKEIEKEMNEAIDKNTAAHMWD